MIFPVERPVGRDTDVDALDEFHLQFLQPAFVVVQLGRQGGPEAGAQAAVLHQGGDLFFEADERHAEPVGHPGDEFLLVAGLQAPGDPLVGAPASVA